jgi:EmrB/QacA subfamily drug resistance transporter
MIPENRHDTTGTERIPYKWKALVTVSLSILMVTMDFSITNISFPILSKIFNADLTTVMWVSLVYTLVSTSLLLVLGRIGDLVGRKRIFSSGMIFFSMGLLICSVAQSIESLILFRGIQAIGTAMIISCGTAIVTEAFPVEERGKGLGIIGVSVSSGMIIGPLVGGILLRWFDWRSIYYCRIPVGIIAVFLSFIILEKDQKYKGRIKIDIGGALTSAFGLASIIYGVSQIKRLGLGSATVLLFICVGMLLLVAFVFIERRIEAPVVELSLFKNPIFSCNIGALLLIFISYPAFVLIMPFFLIQGIGMKVSFAGLLMAVPSGTAMLLGPVSGWMSDRFGQVWFSAFGAIINVIALMMMRNFDLHTQTLSMLPAMILIGAGSGLFQSPNNSTLMGTVPRQHYGTTSALIALQRQVGMSLGMAICGVLFSTRRLVYQTKLVAQGIEPDCAVELATAPAFHDVLLLGIIIGSIAVVLSLVHKRH